MEVRSIDSFLRYFEGIRDRTRRAVEAIPDEKMEWRPGPGRFSFGDLLRHLAALERFMFAENVAGRPSTYPGHGRALASTPEEVRAYFDAMHQEAMKIFGSLSEEDLQRRCTTPAGASLSTWKWLRAMVEHEVHHRGQIYLMLGMIGVEAQPIFGLTSEEVLARSAPETPVDPAP